MRGGRGKRASASKVLKVDPVVASDMQSGSLQSGSGSQWHKFLGKTSVCLLYRSIRTLFGKLTKPKSGAGTGDRTDRDKWILTNFEFLKPHIHEVQSRTIVSKVLCCVIYMYMTMAQKSHEDTTPICGINMKCPPPPPGDTTPICGINVKCPPPPPPITYNNQTVTLCSGFRCKVVQLESVKAVYGVYFSTQKDYEEKAGLRYISLVQNVPNWCETRERLGVPTVRKRSPACQLQSDGDRCCPTFRYATYYIQLQNINGQICSILHMPVWNMYQYTTVGICGNGGKCPQCVLQNTTQTMVAVRAGNSDLTIAQFNIPTYCICLGQV